MAFPNFIIGGPPKCGTTSLYSWLNEHPDACASSLKETYHFYSRTEDVTGEIETFTEKHVADYEQYFVGCEDKKIIFEATPSYIYSKSAIEAFKELNPKMKFLFVIREPAERLYSEYSFHRFKTKRFNGDFRTYAINEIIASGYYDKHLKNWSSAFPKDQIALLSFEDLTSNPNNSMQAICSFLQIDPTCFDGLNLEAKNTTLDFRNRKLHTYLLKMVGILPVWLIKTLAPIYYRINSKAIPPISPADIAYLEELKLHYKSSVAALFNEFGENFLQVNQKVS